jgi:hypothetical protein
MIYLNEFSVEWYEYLWIQDYGKRLYIQVVHAVEQS